MYWPTGANTDPGAIVNGVQRRLYRGRDLANNIGGTFIGPTDMNMLVNEGLAILDAAGVVPNPADLTQQLQAILILIGRAVAPLQTRFTRFAAYAGSGTFVVPGDCTWLRVRVIGCGGGGGAGAAGMGGGGGGSGGYVEGTFSVPAGTSIPVVIGVPGTGGQPGGAGGTNGGSCSFGNYATATGGAGGQNAASFAAGGGGGTGYGSALTVPGGYGSDGSALLASGAQALFPGNGGASVFGAGGRAAISRSVVQNAQSYGSGGGGTYDRPEAGGSGAFGLVLVEF